MVYGLKQLHDMHAKNGSERRKEEEEAEGERWRGCWGPIDLGCGDRPMGREF